MSFTMQQARAACWEASAVTHGARGVTCGAQEAYGAGQGILASQGYLETARQHHQQGCCSHSLYTSITWFAINTSIAWGQMGSHQQCCCLRLESGEVCWEPWRSGSSPLVQYTFVANYKDPVQRWTLSQSASCHKVHEQLARHSQPHPVHSQSRSNRTQILSHQHT